MTNVSIQTVSDGRSRKNGRITMHALTLVLAYWTVVFRPIQNMQGILSYLKYTPDGILLLMIVLGLSRKKIKIHKDLRILLRIVLIFFFYCLVVYLFQYQSAAYFLWGFRNNFRFYLAFFAFIAYLNKKDVETWFRIMDILFWVNAGLAAIQFYVLGIGGDYLGGDYLGGIFGIKGASNTYTICLLSVVLAKTLLDTYTKKKKTLYCVLVFLTSCLVAAMAEIKMFFFIVVYLIVGASLLTRFSIRKVLLMITGAIMIMIGTGFLIEYYGFEDFFSMEKLIELATNENYASKNDLNRWAAIPTLCKRVITNPIHQLFGLGLGNCDTSAFAVCNTPFFQQYEYLHYIWFASAMIFLETGFLGFGIYISFFVVCARKTFKWVKAKIGDNVQNQLALLMAIQYIVMVFYDASPRTEPGYMMYFVLALPFIQRKNIRQESGIKFGEGMR